MSDLSSDIFTTGEFDLNGLTDGVFDFDGDEDWYRFEAEAYHHYDVGVANGNLTAIARQIFDSNGDLYWDMDLTGKRFIPMHTGTYFLAAAQPDPSVINYQLSGMVPIDDFGFFDERYPRNVDFYERLGGVIETEGDADVMTFTFVHNVDYTVFVDGSDSGDATLANPIVRLYRFNDQRILEPIVVDNNGGIGRSAAADVRLSDEDERLFVMVNAVAGTGSYRIRFEADDDYGDTRAGAKRLGSIANWNTGPRTFGIIELRSDVDTFVVAAQAGNWYRIATGPLTSNSIPLMRIENPDGVVVNQPASIELGSVPRQGIFYAETSGDYLIEASAFRGIGGGGRLNLGHYQFTVDARQAFHAATPVMTNSIYSKPLEITSDFEFDKLQIHSSQHIRIWNVGESPILLAPNRVHEIATTDRIYVPPGQSTNGRFWTRGFEPVSGKWTAWQKTSTQAGPLDGFSRSDQRLHVGTYAFATALPSYWQGDSRISGFEPFTESEKEAFRATLNAWQIRDYDNPDQSLLELAPGIDNDSAEVMLFKSNIDGEMLVIPNNWDFRDPSKKLADVVLPIGADWLSPSELVPGSRGFFELLRSVGLMMGTPENDDSKELSVMGDRNVGRAEVWPATPLPADYFRSRPFQGELFGRLDDPEKYEIFSVNDGPNTYRLQEFGTQTVSAIMDSGGLDWIVTGVAGDYAIDLNPGAWSVKLDGNVWEFGRSIALNTYIENASGNQAGNDKLTGNWLDNLLIGLGGNDRLRGNAGDDRMYGGPGDDSYLFELGDDRDIVNEQGLGGTDTIEIKGFGSFDSLADLSFRKLGHNDLLIRLQLDGNRGHIEDSIRIRNMADQNSRIETLSLRSVGGEFANVSLLSVFEQVGAGPTRFELAAGSDSYGRLVSPV